MAVLPIVRRTVRGLLESSLSRSFLKYTHVFD